MTPMVTIDGQSLYQKLGSVYEGMLIKLRELAKENPAAYRPGIASVLNKRAFVFSYNYMVQTGQGDQAERDYQKALEVRKRLVKGKSDPFLYDFARTLTSRSVLYLRTQRLKEAEQDANDALTAYQALGAPKLRPYSYALDLDELGLIYSATLRPVDAEQAYQQALEILHELADENPGIYSADFAATLNHIADLSYTRG
jgi:tetratricopeptide (TPR) repeat protein